MLKPGNEGHFEVLDPTPLAKPLNLRIPSQSERIMQYVRFEQMRAQESREVETFEEADDFDMDDGDEWFSPFEEIFEAQPGATDFIEQPPAPASSAPPVPPDPGANPPGGST